MKTKNLIKLLPAFIMAVGFVSCSDEKNDEPVITTDAIQNGFYVINNGNMAGNIPSSVTSYNYDSGVSTPSLEDAFLKANGISLGEGAGKALVYGDKMYIPMYDSNLIWVVNAADLKVIDRIRPEGEATGPRCLAASSGKVYASMFTGYVSRIDTVSLKIDKTIKTGPNTEQMAVAGGKLYVANSDGYSYGTENEYANSSISIIDIASFTETKIQDMSKVMNPTDLVSNGTEVFVICKGNYKDVPSMVKKIVGNDVTDVALGNYMAINGNKLYVINDIYGVPREEMGFNVYNTSTLQFEGLIAKQTPGTESWIYSPAGIDVDPVTGDIVILSYNLNESGIMQYMSPAFANIYDNNGNFKKRVECGVGPEGVTFVHF